jgi:DNA repair photolyase
MGQQTVRERGGVQYRELRARSLLNRCDSPRMPFQWTVNPYRGCAFGCRYCYATYTHEFMGIAEPEEFHRLIYVKVGAEAETARRLAAVVRRGQTIALGTATDPYQPGEAEARVTRRFLELVAQHRGVRLGITTKGALILRDLDLLRRIHGRSRVSVHFSLTTLDADLLRKLEPWAPPPEVRLEAVRRLAEAGIEVALNAMPILPGLTDAEAGLDALFARAAAAGAHRAAGRLLFLRSPTKEKYLRWLAAEFPRYLEAYQQAYAGRVFLAGRYQRHVQAMVERLLAKHGLGPRRFEEKEDEPEPQQLVLWA